MSKFSDKAVELYKEGYSCSESIARAASECNIVNVDKELITSIATSFSGGMGSGCVCGAVAGSQMVIGLEHGRKSLEASASGKIKAKEFIDEFKSKHKVTCCKALTGKYEFGSPERKTLCTGLVKDCAEILEKMI